MAKKIQNKNTKKRAPFWMLFLMTLLFAILVILIVLIVIKFTTPTPESQMPVLSGFVKLKEGNCMPPINPDLCTKKLVNAQVAVFYKINPNQMQGNYFKPIIGPIKLVNSDFNGQLGYYEMSLAPGVYSIFAKDSKSNNDFYCNSISSDCACCVNITSNQNYVFDITIDHSNS